ncbi:MAG: GAF domain-containing protein [Flavobacteriales bacterium]|nr:GAF domain-containing protein [Flavobacteriales bacterium]
MKEISNDRTNQYTELIPQIESLVQPEADLVANLANISAALHQIFQWHWVGFYRAQGEQLILGPFQGPVACTRIDKGKGVCGDCFEKGETIIVDDVHQYPGHIACSPHSNSEIVIPVFDNDGKVTMVLDIDSTEFKDFSQVDDKYLTIIARLITNKLN